MLSRFFRKARTKNRRAIHTTPRVNKNRRFGAGGPLDQAVFDKNFSSLRQPLYKSPSFWFLGTFFGSIALFLLVNRRKEKIPFSDRERVTYLPKWLEAKISDYVSLTIKSDIPQDKILEPHTKEHIFVTVICNKLCKANNIPTIPCTVIQNDQANAFVFSGELFLFTGILPVMEGNPSAAAMVLAHEIGHSLAGHASDNLLSLAAFYVIGSLMSYMIGLPHNSYMFKVTNFLWSLFFHLPRSRSNEIEADKIGLHLMATACFDIYEASTPFKKLKELTFQSSRSGFWGWVQSNLDTHPSLDLRIENLEKWKNEPFFDEMLLLCKKQKEKDKEKSWNFFSFLYKVLRTLFLGNYAMKTR